MDCLFCKIINGEIPSKKIYEDDYVLAILDIQPSANGHTLLIPKKHFTDMLDIDDEYIKHIFEVQKKLTKPLMEKINAESLSLRVNYGSTQLIKHFHMHMLPDYDIKKPTLSQDEAYEILKEISR